MPSAVYLSTIGKLLDWAKASALSYVHTGSSCCADEVMSSVGCRYDLERFGCVQAPGPDEADLLIVSGTVTEKAAPHLRALYDSMRFPKYVLAVGTCANSGGLFGLERSAQAAGLPVDVFVPGCPPRPEAIMDGLISLQEKIRGNNQHARA